jgi:hypothetical protein
VKEFAKIVGLPQILKLPLFAGHPSLWQMFVYSIFSDKNKLRDVCRLPICVHHGARKCDMLNLAHDGAHELF